MALLEAEDQQVSFASPDSLVPAVRGVSFSADAGQLRIVGESRMGVFAQAIVGLTKGAVVSGQARFAGRDMRAVPAGVLRRICRCEVRAQVMELIKGVLFGGNDITRLSRRLLRPCRRQVQMIFQDPRGSLNPRGRADSMIGDLFAIHDTAGGQDWRRQVRPPMEMVVLNPVAACHFPLADGTGAADPATSGGSAPGDEPGDAS